MAQLHADVSSPLSFRRPIVRRAVESKIFSSEWQSATVSLAGDAQVCHLERSGTSAVGGAKNSSQVFLYSSTPRDCTGSGTSNITMSSVW
jgi:hypothetical protein